MSSAFEAIPAATASHRIWQSTFENLTASTCNDVTCSSSLTLPIAREITGSHEQGLAILRALPSELHIGPNRASKPVVALNFRSAPGI
jgi:hypothetical protein